MDRETNLQAEGVGFTDRSIIIKGRIGPELVHLGVDTIIMYPVILLGQFDRHTQQIASGKPTREPPAGV